MNPPSRAAAALWYAKHQLSVLPVRGKIPLTRNGVHDASGETKAIIFWWRSWPDAGVAVAVPDTYVVVDVDGPDGWAALRAAGHGLPSTLTAITGRGDSFKHCWFRLPDGVRARNGVGIVDHVDVRTAGGYVVAPPSVHASGRRYEWVGGWPPDPRTITEAPEWLVELLSSRTTERAATLRDEWSQLIAGPVPEGRRNEALARVVGMLFCRLPAIVAADLAALWARNRCDPPLSEQEIQRTVASIARCELRQYIGEAP